MSKTYRERSQREICQLIKTLKKDLLSIQLDNQSINRYSFILLNCIVLYSGIYIAPLNNRGPTEALLVRLAPKKRQVLRRDKNVYRKIR